MNEPKPSSRKTGRWVIAFIAGGLIGALVILLILQDQLLSAFWSFTGQ
jgi:hypothetical protein